MPICAATAVFLLVLPDVDLHFWDSPDDVLGAHMDLIFERDRVYLHKATGSFGAIPLRVSGTAMTQTAARGHSKSPVKCAWAVFYWPGNSTSAGQTPS